MSHRQRPLTQTNIVSQKRQRSQLRDVRLSLLEAAKCGSRWPRLVLARILYQELFTFGDVLIKFGQRGLDQVHLKVVQLAKAKVLFYSIFLFTEKNTF